MKVKVDYVEVHIVEVEIPDKFKCLADPDFEDCSKELDDELVSEVKKALGQSFNENCSMNAIFDLDTGWYIWED